VETLSTSALWRSTAVAPLAPTARAIGADWDALVVIRSSSGVDDIGVEAGWMVSGLCVSRSIVRTPVGVMGRMVSKSNAINAPRQAFPQVHA
jgi:hypothetical protein